MMLKKHKPRVKFCNPVKGGSRRKNQKRFAIINSDLAFYAMRESRACCPDLNISNMPEAAEGAEALRVPLIEKVIRGEVDALLCWLCTDKSLKHWVRCREKWIKRKTPKADLNAALTAFDEEFKQRLRAWALKELNHI